MHSLERETERWKKQENGESIPLPKTGHGYAAIPSLVLRPVGIWGTHAHVPGMFFKLLQL